MPKQVVTGAMMRCSFGTASSTFIATPKRVVSGHKDAGNIRDHASMRNIHPFGRCRTVAFPPTAVATAAAKGRLTPMPCIPNTPAPWVNGAVTVPTAHAPGLDDVACLFCVYGGVIQFDSPGQYRHDIP